MFVEVSASAGASIERVWATLLEPARWWPGTTLEPWHGGQLRETWTNEAGDEVVTTGSIERFDPPASLAMTWSDDDWPANGATFVEIDLVERSGPATAITVRHSGWEQLGEIGEQLVEPHRRGWTRHLEALVDAAQGHGDDR